MNNLHPIMTAALAPFAPLPMPKRMRVFAVSMHFDAHEYGFNILAHSTADAISKSLEMIMANHDDADMPVAGLLISCKPAAVK